VERRRLQELVPRLRRRQPHRLPGFVWQYQVRTRKVELADFELLAATRTPTAVG